MAGMESLMQCEHYAGTRAALLKLWSPDQLHSISWGCIRSALSQFTHDWYTCDRSGDLYFNKFPHRGS